LVTIEDACLRYLEAQKEFLRSDDMPSVWAFRRASDDLLGAFHAGIPDKHLSRAWLSFRQALVRAGKDEPRCCMKSRKAIA
jgi:hypothetical protein